MAFDITLRESIFRVVVGSQIVVSQQVVYSFFMNLKDEEKSG